MSHFTVTIITEDIEGVEDILAPYDENFNELYFEFEDNEDDLLYEYDNCSTTMVKTSDGLFFTPDGALFIPSDAEPLMKEKYEKLSIANSSPDILNSVEVKVPFNELFCTFEGFVNDWHGISERDERYNRFGSWYNPNAKFDWFCIGGRWKGKLLVKDTAEYLEGEPGVFGDPSEEFNNADNLLGFKWVDAARIKDIQWELMDEVNRENAKILWKKALNVDDSRKYMEYGIRTDDTKESYLKRSTQFSTYAVVTEDGTWHEKGSMGWFGMGSETEEEARSWEDSFYDTFIKNIDPNSVLTIADCHI